MFVGSDGQKWELVTRQGKQYLRRFRYDTTVQTASPARVATWKRMAKAADLSYGFKGKEWVNRSDGKRVLMPNGAGALQRFKGLPIAAEHISAKRLNRKEVEAEAAKSLGVPQDRLMDALKPFISKEPVVVPVREWSAKKNSSEGPSLEQVLTVT